MTYESIVKCISIKIMKKIGKGMSMRKEGIKKAGVTQKSDKPSMFARRPADAIGRRERRK